MLLLDYLKLSLGKLNTTLGYSFSGSASDDFAIVLEDTLTDYGVASEGEATDTTKLRKLGIYNMWKKVMVDVVDNINFSADGASYSNEQLYNHVQEQYKNSLFSANSYLSQYQATVQNFNISASCVHDEFHHWR